MRILGLLITAGLVLIILGVALSIGAKITQDVQDTMESNTTAHNVAGNATVAIGTLAEWKDTIATVIAAVVIIGLLMAGFGGFLAIRGGGI